MAQILFSDLMNAYRQPGNDGENQQKFGKYADEKHFKHSYTVRYKQLDMNPVEFMDWIVQYMSGMVMLSDNRIWFNDDADESTLVLAFSGQNSYGEPYVWKWHKNPNTKNFERNLPWDGVWRR